MPNSLEHQFAAIRAQFPMLQQQVNGHPFVYLDTAATAQKPQCVIDAITRFYSEQYGTVHRAVYTTAAAASEAYQLVRQRVARFLHARSEDEIVFTRGTTNGINTVAGAFGKAFVHEGDEILITEMEHHSNIVPWQLLCEARGAHLNVVPFLENGDLDMEAFATLLTERTKLMAVTQVSNVLGTLNPIKSIVEQCHRKGAKVLVDGAQSAPHMPVDVQELDCDFFVFSGHKAIGPTGIGVLYGKRELLDAMPPYEGGGDMIETVTFPKTTYGALPLKFEAGTPMIAEVIGLGAAIDFLESIGMDKIHAWEQELLPYVLPRVEAIEGLRVLGHPQHKQGMITFTVDGIHPLDIATMLDLKGIAIRTGHLCVQPIMRHYGITAAARASLGLYTNREDLDRFVEGLQEVIRRLR